MLQSMTGFGKTEVIIDHRSYNIMLKSVNSKNADLNIKLSSAHREKENEVRSLLLSELQRGKVDLYVSMDSGNGDQNMSVNSEVFSAYFSELKELAKNADVSEDSLFKMAMRMPNVLSQTKEEETDSDWTKVEKGIRESISQLVGFRKKEGAILEKDLLQRVNQILSLMEDIRPFEKERVESVKKKLQNQFEQIENKDSINRDRFEQELIYYFEKFDITEEKVRLVAHCNLFIETVNSKESQGRKLGFIGQEMGREINTIGSKANHAKIQQIVVDMKDELEKIKEQLFNIL